MALNYLLIVLIIIAIVYVAYRVWHNIDTEDEIIEEIDSGEVDLKFLIKETAQAFSRTLKKNINDDNMTQAEMIRKERRRTSLRQAMTNAGYGDEAAKRTVKNNIKELLMNEKYEIDNKSINSIIPFDSPEKLKGNDLFEIVLYCYNKKFGAKGFHEMMEEWDLTKPVIENGESKYKVTSDIMRYIYKALLFETDPEKMSEKLGHVELDFNDKIEILAQKIFEKYVGLGPVDMLNETSVDNIEGGASGAPGGSFKAKTEQKNIPFSYESVWITYRGIKMQLDCCSFETQEELERVVNNIYRYQSQHVLSRNNPKIIGTMINGARITVSRPPFSDSYYFSIRKFDSAESVKPAALIRDENNVIPITYIKWIIKGQRNTLITGAQGTGKTTFLRSTIRFIPHEFSLRIQEIQSELNLRYTYPDRNIVAFQETGTISAQEGLNFQKKSNGDVNIIGEIAEAMQTSHFIQTSTVASLFSLGTHHAKTAKALVHALANNLLELGMYKDKKDAIEMVADVVNIDCHLVNVKGNRHIERITEIIPIKDREYPSSFFMEDMNYKNRKEEAEFKTLMDAPEYMRRVTDPELFEVKDILRWVPVTDADGKQLYNEWGFEVGKFVLVNGFSENMKNEIMSKLTKAEEEEFLHDLDMCEHVSDGTITPEVSEWMETVLSY